MTKLLRYTALQMFALTTLQVSGQNYVKTENYLDENGSHLTTSIQYYDGIGRKSISASNAVSPSGKYVYTMQTYDIKGRDEQMWFPAVGSTTPVSLSYSDFETLSSSTYNGDYYGYFQNTYDLLGRVIRVDGAGSDWRTEGRHVSKRYDVNGQHTVKHYWATLDGDSLKGTGDYYPEGCLTMEETTDEDGRKTQVYKDFLDRTILERSIAADSLYDTYYVYNGRNQLCFVLSPEFQKSGYKDVYGYEYRYDNQGQMVKKIRPQCAEEQMFYDSQGRVIYTKDALGQYKFFFYDELGRQVIKGSCNNFNYHHYADVTMQSGQDGLFGTGYVYSYPSALTAAVPNVVTFYDDYQFLSKTKFTANPHCSALLKSSPANATGLQTGSIVRTSTNQFLLTANYYDNLGRITDKREILEDNSIRITTFTYSFTDKPLTETTTLNRNGLVSTEVKTYTYYASNDKLHTVSIAYNGNSPVTVAEYTYNDLGQVATLTRGGNAGSIDYTYNLRGWTTTINGLGFKEWLYYTGGQGIPYYSGNISSLQWQSGVEGFKRGYKFTYDSIGRMQKAAYGEGDDFSVHQDRYTEWVKEYMQSGAVRKIERYGKKSDGKYGKIDNLRFYYNGMQVERVKEDAAPVTTAGAFDFVSQTVNVHGGAEYSYYADGALEWDANKGISLIDYDKFGNPSRVQFSNGNVTQYKYTATGEKLRTIFRTAVPNITVPLGSTISLSASNTLSVDSINYYGNFIFENGQLSQCLFDGGYATFSSGQPVFHYYTKDHLGNNRAMVNHDGTLEQTVHYYPFGATYSDVGRNQSLQRYKYNGKELDRMHGLNLYDYGARQYDPLLCRFNTIDPLAEKYYNTNPYAYCTNNPVNAIDKEGRYITYINHANGKTYVYHNGNFYHSTFTLKNGVLSPKDRGVDVPLSSHMGRTLQALRKMENSSNKIVRKVFNDLANLNSGKEHVISVGISNEGSFTTAKDSGGDSFIYVNYDYDKNHAKNGTTFTDYEILGHELKHAYDIQYTKNSRVEDKYKIKLDEYKTVNFENLIRKEEGRPMRTNYDGHPIPDELKGVITLW